MSVKTITKQKTKRLLSPGYNSCAGCGEMIAIKTVVEALGPNTIIVNATGCSEVTTTLYPQSSWGMPWIHSLFENASAVASGIRAALDYKEKHPTPSLPFARGGGASPSLRRRGLGEVNVVAHGGDGATFDIGLGLISGMWERGDDVLYICYDTEAYSNTGIQASGATPWGANTTTTPASKILINPPTPLSKGGDAKYPPSKGGRGGLKNSEAESLNSIGFHQKTKDMIAIALAHGVKYVAQTSAGFPLDIEKKVNKALTIKGPKYIQILTPCIPGWLIDTSKTVKMGKLAAQTGLYPVLEYIDGKLVNALKVSTPAPKVDEYLKMQGRFAHLFKSELGKKQIEYIQKIADENIGKYEL
jgi:pyruvate ferredoxin oxidoreductase beta subunit